MKFKRQQAAIIPIYYRISDYKRKMTPPESTRQANWPIVGRAWTTAAKRVWQCRQHEVVNKNADEPKRSVVPRRMIVYYCNDKATTADSIESCFWCSYRCCCLLFASCAVFVCLLSFTSMRVQRTYAERKRLLEKRMWGTIWSWMTMMCHTHWTVMSTDQFWRRFEF